MSDAATRHRIRWRRAFAVFWKDTLELRKNRGLLLSLLALPTVMVLSATGVVASYLSQAGDPSLRVMAVYYDKAFQGDPALFLVERTLTDWLGLYLVMPVFVPMLISSQAIAGERERRTLEPLLSSPVSALELMVGKSLASIVPSLTISFASFGVLCLSVNQAAQPYLGRGLLPDRTWLFGVFVLSPLFAFFGNAVAVLISALVKEARLAQQLSGLFLLPLLGLVAAQAAGLLRAGVGYYAAQGAVVLLLNVILMVLSVRVLSRERLLSGL